MNFSGLAAIQERVHRAGFVAFLARLVLSQGGTVGRRKSRYKEHRVNLDATGSDINRLMSSRD